MASTFVVHYSEVALKGKNRPVFVRALRRNIARALAAFGTPHIESKEGRFLVRADGEDEEIASSLSKVFGVAWFSTTVETGPDYGQIRDAVVSSARKNAGATFLIDARRADKSYPIGSMELARRLGRDVEDATGKKVDLARKESAVHVDVLRNRALVYSGRTRGLGGLPVGTSGRVVHLFSGGIDSPVAAWLLMKRGCIPVYLHFYLAPTPAYALESKVTKIVKTLSAYCGRSTLILIPFAEYQLATADAPPELEPSLFRRFMRVTAEALAPSLSCVAISTGDCLAQAASQTLWNIGTFDKGSSLPVLRPLLSYDKEEVVALARRIGTYDLSLEEYKDCCAIITRHPKTRAREEVISEYASRLDFKRLATESIEAGTVASYNPVSGIFKVAPLRDTLGKPQVSAGLAEAKI